MDPTTLDLRIQNTKASIEKTKRTLERHEKQREKRSAALKAQGVDNSALRRTRQSGPQRAARPVLGSMRPLSQHRGHRAQ